MKRTLLTTLAVASFIDMFGANDSQATVHYVDANGAHAAPPYTNWNKAARHIQDAVNVSAAGDNIVVTNGVYSGTVNVTNALALVSVNGPQFTTIDGAGTIQCAHLADGASLTGFTLTNGSATGSGGGVSCSSGSAFLTNCVITGNRATGFSVSINGHVYYYPGRGGGVYGCTLYNCIVNDNHAQGGRWVSGRTPGRPPLFSPSYGGGLYASTLINCILARNTANVGGGAVSCTLYNSTLTGNTCQGSSIPPYTFSGRGGGAYGGALYNCIAYFNSATVGPNYDASCNYCCTTPLPTNGVGNTTNAPLFVDANGWSNLRLQSNSPCINSGNNSFVAGSTDLDGNPRIVNGTVDMGAYEFQGAGSTISYAWLQQFGLPLDGSRDFADPDGDGHNNWQEWRCGTCPTNNCSVLRLLSACCEGTNVVVSWQSVAGVNYFVECSTNLAASPSFQCVATNLPGTLDLTTFVHTNAVHAGPVFYRVGVRN